MKHRGFILLGVLLGVLLLGSGALFAQDDAAPEAAAAADTEGAASTTAVDWNEGVFVLLVIALVMGGLIGFEYVHRRKQSI